MSYTEGTPITFRTDRGPLTATFIKYAAADSMALVDVTAPDWNSDRRTLIACDDIIGPATAPLQRGDAVLDAAGEPHVVIRLCSTGTQAEVFPGTELPAVIPSRYRGDWRNVSTLTAVNAGEWMTGDAAAIDGVDGVWLVTEDATQLALREPGLAGHVRLQKVFDGAGPAHLSVTVKTAELRRIEADPDPAPEYADRECYAYGIRLTALDREVVVPVHPAAYASLWHILRQAARLQSRLGLAADAHVVQWCDPWRAEESARWLTVDAPAPHVPSNLHHKIDHNHVYYDDGVTPLVGPCRDLPTCPTSLVMTEDLAQRESGHPRFAVLDLAAERAARAEAADSVEYAMSATQHGAHAPTVTRVPNLADGARIVALTRETQTLLGGKADAHLLARFAATGDTPAGDWRPVLVGDEAVGAAADLR